MPLDTFLLATLRADRAVLEAVLKEAGCTINGAAVKCGFHHDTRASGSIYTGEDGSHRYRCHACGASGDAIDLLQRVRGIGFGEAQAVLTGGNGKGNGRQPGKPKSAASFPTRDDALASLAQRHGPAAGVWTYHNADGEPVGAILRWDRPDGKKDIRPLARVTDGWTVGAMPTPRPLYRLPDLLQRRGEQVYITEGEKCADMAAQIGLLATTSAGGANAAQSADWSPLANRECIILPDRDDAGEKYARDVAQLLGTLGAKVRIVRLPDLQANEDLFEFVHEHRQCKDSDDIKAEIEALAEAATPERGADGVPIEDMLVELMGAVRAGRPAVPSLKTGVELLDQAGGLARGEYMALFGPPGVGKSLLADAIALGILDETPGATVLVFSLETAPIVRTARLACARSVTFNSAGGVDRCVPLRATLDGKLEAYSIERLAATAATITEKYKGRLRFVDDATTASEIAGRIQTFRPTLVLVDHVGLLTPESENATFALDVGLGRLQDALRETGAAGLFIAETDKMSLKAASFGLASIRGSARVASLAGIVSVLAPDDDAPGGIDPGLRLQLLKARHGRAWMEQSGSLLGGLGLVSLAPGVKPIERGKRRPKRVDGG